jgi:hypothetical protein
MLKTSPTKFHNEVYPMIDDDWTPMTLEGELEWTNRSSPPFAKLPAQMSIHWKSKVPNPSRKKRSESSPTLPVRESKTSFALTTRLLRREPGYPRYRGFTSVISRKYAKYKYVMETDPRCSPQNADGTVTPTAKFERGAILSIIVYILEAINL